MKSLQGERRIASDRGQIVYHAFGQGPVVLFINGMGASWHGFFNQITHFSDRYRCLVWDYRGLFSDLAAPAGDAASIEEHARDALAILDAEGVERAAVLGWSAGVQVALQLFAETPARVALLLLVAGGAQASWGDSPDAGPIRRRYSTLIDLMTKAPRLLQPLLQTACRSPETFTWARRMRLVGSGIDPELFADVARNFGRLEVRSALHMLKHMAERDLTPLLGMVDVPTLVVGGDRDPFTSRAALERLVHSIAGAEYLLLPGASHYLLLDHAQLVNLRIDKFFAERGFTQ